MSDLYELKSIDGKGLGAIAKHNIKRGTLILEEKPQIFDDGSDEGNFSIFHQVLIKTLRKNCIDFVFDTFGGKINICR